MPSFRGRPIDKERKSYYTCPRSKKAGGNPGGFKLKKKRLIKKLDKKIAAFVESLATTASLPASRL